MKEKPILFSTEMIKAILEGRKTQTRRVIKPQPEDNVHHLDSWDRDKCEWIKTSRSGKVMIFQEPNIIKCPWQVGQELWVRETFAIENIEGCERVIWKADNCARYFKNEIALDDPYYLLSAYKPKRWKPSIFMPRWASSIQLRIKNIRVERVQDISEEDAKAEGVLDPEGEWREDLDGNEKYNICPNCGGSGLYMSGGLNGVRFDTDCTECDTYKKLFEHLWDSINANRKDKDGNILPYSWECNPFVWALDFERIK